MNDQELDGLVAATASMTDDELGALGLAGPVADLCEAIMSTHHPLSTAPDRTTQAAEPPDASPPDFVDVEDGHVDDAGRGASGRRLQFGSRFRDRPVLSGLAAAMVAAAMVAVVLVQPFGADDRSAWAAEAVAVAEAAPRVLVIADGWEVTGVDEFSVDAGSMISTGPDHTLELSWHSGTRGGYDDRLARWTDDDRYERLSDITVAGHQATLFRGPPIEQGSPEFIVVWPDGEYGVELRGDFHDVDELRRIMATVEEVDVDTWLSALPVSMVRPNDTQQAVADMLTDVPLPPGFDAGSIPAEAELVMEEDLRGHVVGAVRCAWVERWADATAAGDDVAVREAIEAMTGAPHWDVVEQMEPIVAEDMRLAAEAMATDGTLDAGLPDMPIAEVLECDT